MSSYGLNEQSSGINEYELLQWIERSLASGSNRLAAGYQGHTLVYEDAAARFVIKIPHGKGLLKRFNIHMLRHENRVYQQLHGFPGVPECYGMAGGQYLVLQMMDGTTIGEQRPADEGVYFETLLGYIRQMHERGVAHFDLKKKSNLLVVDGSRPCLIDLGVAIINKPGFHPLNHYLFNLAKHFDFNAWIRHKYGNRPDNIAPEDRVYYHKTKIEIYTYKLKRFYKDRFKPLFRS